MLVHRSTVYILNSQFVLKCLTDGCLCLTTYALKQVFDEQIECYMRLHTAVAAAAVRRRSQPLLTFVPTEAAVSAATAAATVSATTDERTLQQSQPEPLDKTTAAVAAVAAAAAATSGPVWQWLGESPTVVTAHVGDVIAGSSSSNDGTAVRDSTDAGATQATIHNDATTMQQHRPSTLSSPRYVLCRVNLKFATLY
jgi:hypothetical protein